MPTIDIFKKICKCKTCLPCEIMSPWQVPCSHKSDISSRLNEIKVWFELYGNNRFGTFFSQFWYSVRIETAAPLIVLLLKVWKTQPKMTDVASAQSLSLCLLHIQMILPLRWKLMSLSRETSHKHYRLVFCFLFFCRNVFPNTTSAKCHPRKMYICIS